MNMPLVSICIPVFNTVKYVRQTIESVLAQQYPNIEILVQDNASTDGTWELIAEFAKTIPQVSIERNSTNCGMAGNWNLVIKRATGDYVMLLSADDLLEPEFISSCIAEFQVANIDVVATHYSILYPDGSAVGRGQRIADVDGIYQDFACEILRCNPFQINFALFSAGVIKKMQQNGRFFSEYVTCDYDLWLRLGLSGMQVKYLAQPLGYYRIHESNTSHNQVRLQWHTLVTLFSSMPKLIAKCPKIYMLTVVHVTRILLAVGMKRLKRPAGGALDKR